MRRAWWWGLMLGAVPLWASEPVHGCFRTAAEAAGVHPSLAKDAMDGAPEGLRGYYLEGVTRDPLLGRSWAVVRSCGHPERPAELVELLRQAGQLGHAAAEASAAQVQEDRKPVVIAGSKVEVVRVERDVRLSLLAVAEQSAALGQRVRLRVLRDPGESEEFVEGVVRGAGLVEMGGDR